MKTHPVLFVSHGAPSLPLTEHPAKLAMQKLGRSLEQPQGIIVISAHWLTRELTISSPAVHPTIHDFYGFPQQLYQIDYPARGSQQITEDLQQAMAAAGHNATIDHRRGLDHGAWIPLLQLYPAADIPVVALSVPQQQTAPELIRIGQALSDLRERYLILCSGAITHNLRALCPEGTPPSPWAIEFTDWVKTRILDGDLEELTHFHQAPHAEQAHPTDEHFLPLFMAAGAADGEPACVLHESFSYGNISMAIFAFGQACATLH